MGAERAVQVLAGNRQCLWPMLKWSITQQFEYWMELTYPSDLRAAAHSLDRKI